MTISSLKEQVRLQTSDIVVLLETKNRSQRYGYLKRQLGMQFMHAVEPRGLSGGLCLFWKEMSQDEENGAKWCFFAVYASTDERVRRSQWQILQDRMAQCQEACLLMGDFNDIMDVSEKRGGLPRTERSLYDFSMFVVNSHLLDLGYVGHPFTWRNKQQEGGIMERLDRGFGNDQWVTLYPAATVHHVVVPGSNHGDSEECRKVVEERWCRQFPGSRGLQISGKLCWVRKGILDWRRSEWRISKATIALLQQQLKATYLAPDFDRDEVLQLESSLKEAFWEEEEIFTMCSPSNIEYITDCVQPRVTMQQSLTPQISSEEIWLAVKSLNPTKSPGPDGFTGKFFQQYWDVVGEDISGMVKSFFSLREAS
ncbi:unnamed protein product [Prunus armeniaca]|uniref:Endonuclease/exonuclease/phosphatase domain-containing protein n=1 Tax=Prunus armeniaca TaxID=36596 RepID=A0A6J5TXC9_PRUAR|nr:unnamed protein product [Prunus armeniaca]